MKIRLITYANRKKLPVDIGRIKTARVHLKNGIKEFLIMSSVSVSKARQTMKDLVNRVVYRKERIYLTAHNKKVAAIVPMEDIETLQEKENSDVNTQ